MFYSPELAFTVRTRMEIVPLETKDAAVTVISEASSGAVSEMSLRSCGPAESSSPDNRAGLGASLKKDGEASRPGNSKSSDASMFLAKRTAVRRSAKTSSTSPSSVTPTITDEVGETSADWDGVNVFSFIASRILSPSEHR